MIQMFPPKKQQISGSQDSLEKAFKILRVPVSNRLYRVFVHRGNHPAPSHWHNDRPPLGLDDHPVMNVSWHDANAFCQWWHVYLPSVLQWRWAARGPGNAIYSWGNQPPNSTLCNFNLDRAKTTPVGQFPDGASIEGLLDCAGNVWEWTNTPREATHVAPSSTHQANKETEYYLVGGSFYDAARCMRTDALSWASATTAEDCIGFRVALPVHLESPDEVNSEGKIYHNGSQPFSQIVQRGDTLPLTSIKEMGGSTLNNTLERDYA